jgi:hypothetical protein
MAIVEAKVKPVRARLKREALAHRWWQFGEKQPALQRAMTGLTRVLVISRVSRTGAFVFTNSSQVLNEKIVVFPRDDYKFFSILQSRVHETWARFFNTTLKDDMQYTPSDCFETFPLPNDWEILESIEEVGSEYHQFRANLMISNDEGLTATHNRFHNPDERNPEIIKLRELQDVMDRAVLDAYRWTDLKPTCEFILDYEEEENDDSKPSRKKKPWRYRWPDEFRDEVLARLLALNQERAAQEKIMGGGSKDAKKAKQRPRSHSENKPLFE